MSDTKLRDAFVQCQVGAGGGASQPVGDADRVGRGPPAKEGEQDA